MAGNKQPRSNPPPAIFPGRRRLDSWKEIASYLDRSEKTVRRWEEKEGLPVHRLLHEKRSSVYAYTDELETWWKSRKSQDAIDVDPPGEESPRREDKSVIAEETFPPPSLTSISSGRSGKRDETQVDAGASACSIQCKDSGRLPYIACCSWNSDRSFTRAAFANATFPNAAQSQPL